MRNEERSYLVKFKNKNIKDKFVNDSNKSKKIKKDSRNRIHCLLP